MLIILRNLPYLIWPKSVGFYGRVNSFLDFSFFNHVHWQQNNKPMAANTAFVGDVTKNKKINDFLQKGRVGIRKTYQ